MFLKLLISSLAVYFTALILPGISIKSFWAAIGAAIVIGLLNVFVKPVMIILTIPITILTLGLFLFVINALVIMLAGALMKSFTVKSFWWAMLFSIVMTFVSQILGKLF